MVVVHAGVANETLSNTCVSMIEHERDHTQAPSMPKPASVFLEEGKGETTSTTQLEPGCDPVVINTYTWMSIITLMA